MHSKSHLTHAGTVDKNYVPENYVPVPISLTLSQLRACPHGALRAAFGSESVWMGAGDFAEDAVKNIVPVTIWTPK